MVVKIVTRATPNFQQFFLLTNHNIMRKTDYQKTINEIIGPKLYFMQELGVIRKQQRVVRI